MCERCGEFRIVRKHAYATFCNSCSRILGEKTKGKKHPNYGKRGVNSFQYKGGLCTCFCLYCGKEFPIAPSLIKIGGGKYCSRKCRTDAERGERHPNYKGGKKIVLNRAAAKRKRDLGYTLLMPLKDGEAGHHVTNEYVIGVPAGVHNGIGGSRRKHRTRVLQWLKANDKKKYKIVLCFLAKQ
jgi:hypothetical protein